MLHEDKRKVLKESRSNHETNKYHVIVVSPYPWKRNGKKKLRLYKGGQQKNEASAPPMSSLRKKGCGIKLLENLC